MNKKISYCLIFLLLIPMSFVSAKRMAPKPVEEIFFGVKFSASHPDQKMGYLYAFSTTTGEKLWEKKLYDVSYEPFLETDVQDVYISELKAEGDKLIVINEKGDRYEVNPSMGESLNNRNMIMWPTFGGVFLLVVVVLVFLIYRFHFRK